MKDLARNDFDKLLSGAEIQRLDKGEILLAEGELDTALYILLEGEVEVLVPTKKGWLRVAVLGEGSVIGEMAFLDDLPRSARVNAVTPCSASRITRESFQEFAQRDPTTALSFIWELSRIVAFRLRDMERLDAAEAAREEERKTLSEELHDETLSDLGSLAVELAFMKRKASSISPDLGSGLDEIRDRLRGIDRRLREIVQGIYPPVLAVRGLELALIAYLNDLSARTIVNPCPLEIELVTTGFDKEERLSEEVEIGIYRVIQQGAANVIQHAQAKRLLIDITWSDSELTFSLADDGVGFDVNNPKENPSTGHFGVVNLRDRIERLLGTFQIESQVSVGTTIRGRVPVVNENARPKVRQISTFILDNQQSTDEAQIEA